MAKVTFGSFFDIYMKHQNIKKVCQTDTGQIHLQLYYTELNKTHVLEMQMQN